MKKEGDRYSSFFELKKNESTKAFRIVCVDRKSVVSVAAPHGGKIEPGTSELAREIAGSDLSLYLFEGCKVKHNREDLHITSDRFDEPSGLALLQNSSRVIAVHGEQSDAQFVRVGGRDERRVRLLRIALRELGFNIDPPAKDHLDGVNPRNICNIGKEGGGVQLEISRGLRDALLDRRISNSNRCDQRRAQFCLAARQILMAE